MNNKLTIRNLISFILLLLLNLDLAGSSHITTKAPGLFSVLSYGAVPNDDQDDSDAFLLAILQIKKYGGGQLLIPAGDFNFDKQVKVNLSGVKISITGEGQGVSTLIGKNEDGIISFIDESCTWQVTINNLSLIAGLKGAGSAIEVISEGKGARFYRSLLVRDVDIRSGKISPSENYFNHGIRSIGQWRPLFENIITCGATGRSISYRKDDDALVFQMAIGFQVDWSYAPVFENCYSWSSRVGYQLVSEGKPQGPEDAAFRRCIANSVRIGMLIDTPIKEPSLVIDACHINARDAGIILKRRKFFWITDNLLYGIDSKRVDQPYIDILLIDCYDGIITGNIFHSPAVHNTKDEPEVDHVMIKVNNQCRDLVIKNNIFNAKGKAFDVANEAKNIMLQDNHKSNPQVDMRTFNN